MSSPIRISVVINTYNRAPYLERLLAGLNQLTYDAFEVVVVNGPSTDGTEALLERYAGRIKVVACPMAHMTTSRNLGVKAAAGDVLVFIDDDALPADRRWLDNIARVFAADSTGAVGAVGGPAFHYDTPFFQFKRGMTSDYAQQVFWGDGPGAPVADQRRWVRRTVGCNSAFRRAALVRIGGFDEWIHYYGDEADVCLRLSRLGYETAQPDDCAVRHYPAQSTHLGAPFLRNRRLIAQDDTYSCLKNGNDPTWKRVLKTLRLAPRKLFVRDMPKYFWDGKIGLGALLYFFLWQWPKGLFDGFRAGLFRERRTADLSAPPPAFLPFGKLVPERKLRIAIVTIRVPPDPGISGVERYSFDLARGLHALGHEVHVLCQSETFLRRESLGLSIHGIPRDAFPDGALFRDRPVLNKNLGYGLAVARKLESLYREGVEFDVLHTTNWDLMAVCPVFHQMYPFVLMLVSPLVEVIAVQGWPVNDDMRMSVALDRWQVEHADMLCAPSRGILDAYRSSMGVDFAALDPVRTVVLGIAPALRKAAAPDRSSSRVKRLLFVGRLEHRKGAHVLLDVLPGLLARHSDWRCDLVGALEVPGHGGIPMMRRFLAEHADAEWLARVRFHGPVSDDALFGFYQACDLFVAPSLFESFGLIYVEAMQFGKAVVGCRTSGIPEVITDGVDGLLAEPGDSSSLEAALDRLMSDDDLRERLGRAGLWKARHELSHTAMAERMVPHYLDLIERKGPERLQARRERMAAQDVVLDFEAMERDECWRQREATPGVPYLFTDRPHAPLCLEVPGDTMLSLVTLQHPWSGVLTVEMDGEPPVYFDLFSRKLDLETVSELRVPGRHNGNVRIRLAVRSERNPESRGTEAWLKRISYRRLSHP
jgi:hypothetical protein